MIYGKRNLMDSDSRLVKFTGVHEDIEEHDTVVYVRFKYDLSEDQVDSIKDSADAVAYEGFDAFEEWVADVVDSAMRKDCWKHDKDNDWEFWSPFPCLEIET